MYDYRGKVGGLIVSAIGLAGIVLSRVLQVTIVGKFTLQQQLAVFQWLTIGGLLVAGFSKEKNDDDRAMAIRLKALQVAFLVQNAAMLAVGLVSSTHPEEIPGSLFYMFAAFGTIMYLLLFHVGLHFDFLWDYDNSRERLRGLAALDKNKWGILVYLLVSAIALLALTIFE